MANTTLTSTLPGIMETLQADVQAVYATRAKLLDACMIKEGDGVNAVQFPIEGVPSAASAVAEDGTVSATTVTLEDAVATYANYPVNVQASNLAIKGGSASSMAIANTIAGKLGKAIDAAVCALFSDFDASTGSTGVDFSMDLLIEAIGTLESVGYAGQMVAVLHPMQWANIASDAVALAGVKSDEITSKGYVANILGVDIFVSADVTDDATDYSGGLFYKETGIGLAVRNPVIDIFEPILNTANGGHDFYGEAQFKAVNLTDALGADLCLGGVELISGV